MKKGEIEITLKFWRGLSSYHKTYANKGRSTDVRGVMEVLDTASDERDMVESEDYSDEEPKDKLKTHTNQDSSASEDDNNGPVEKFKGMFAGHNSFNDGSRGPMAQVRDFKDYYKQLHRKHRGVMQWKGEYKEKESDIEREI